MRHRKYFIPLSLFLLLSTYHLSLTSRISHIWGMPWSQDMFDQPSSKAQEDITPPIPGGVIQTEGQERPIKNRVDAASLQNPIRQDPKSLARGKVLYETYCAICHGVTGIGNGIVGKKFVHPTDLSDIYVQVKPDGDIFYTITYDLRRSCRYAWIWRRYFT